MEPRAPALKDILYLLSIPNMGPARIRRLLSVFGSAEELSRAPLQCLTRIEGIDRVLAQQLKAGGDSAAVEKQLQLIDKQRVKTVSIWQEGYPELLKKTADPPLLLFYKGTLPEKWPPCIGIVGTRMPSAYGKGVTERLVSELVRKGITIVSGFARGIDTVAHRTALRKGSRTFAILGCGVDVIYPAENKALAEQIAANGAMISEFFLGTGPDAVNFPRRNRIISGVSLGVVVMEAGQKSGALITAGYALDQNREVFAVPGQITNPKTVGTHRLIQQGAKLVHTVDDILEEIEASLESVAGKSKAPPPDLSPLERKILERLSSDPKHIDRLVMELEEAPASILASLLNLELAGLVRQLSGKMFIRI